MFLRTVISLMVLAATLFAGVTPGDFGSVISAIEALPAAGGEVFIPAGRYDIAQTIVLGDNVTLRGAGEGTVLVAGVALDANLRQQRGYLDEEEFPILFNPQYRHAALIKNADPDGGGGMRIYDLTIEMDRDELRCVSAIYLQNCERVTLRGLSISDCGGSAVILHDCRDAKLSDLRLERNHNGVYVKGYKDTCRDVTITNCSIRENRWCGIYINKSGPHGGALTDGPENITIANNHIYDHMTDTAIKLHGPRFIIITGNRIDRALEAGIECNGASDMVCSNNIVTRIDDGMNLRGNGCAIYFGRQIRPANLAINSNVTTESGIGIWSETIFQGAGPDGRNVQGAVGGVAVTGNVAHANIAYGMGGCAVQDAAWVGNVNIDNGQHAAPSGQDTAGMLFTAGCARMNVTGNVASDRRQESANLMQSALVIRGSKNILADDNVLFGGKDHQVREYGNEKLQMLDNLTEETLEIAPQKQ